MTDEQTEPDAGELAIVPTGKAWLQLSERVAALEEQQPAEVAADQDPHARLDRHRAELEAIKRAFNTLVEYVSTLSPDPGTAPQQLQPAPTATTPTREDYL